MVGKNNDRASTERKKAKLTSLKVLSALFMILLITIVPANAVSIIRAYSDVHLVQDQIAPFRQKPTSKEIQYQSLLKEERRLHQENTSLKEDNAALLGSADPSIGDSQAPSNTGNLVTTNPALTGSIPSSRNGLITAPYVSIADRTIHVAFYNLDGSLVQWVIPFSSFETEMVRANEVRTGFLGLGLPTIILQEKSGKELLVADFRKFMDTQAFTTVMTSMYEQSPDDYTFIKEVWSLVGQLVQYQSEIGEIPRFPLETLVGGGGDCEDYAILFASLIEAAPVNWSVQFVYINADSPQDTQGISNHVIVYIDTGKEKHYIETTSSHVMEPYKDGVAGWYLPVE